MMPLPFIVRIECAKALANNIGDGSIRRQRHVLDQSRDASAGLSQHEARIGLQIAAENLQQRRLAGAVAPDDGDALAGVHLEGDLVEQREMAEGDGDTVERYERHGISKRTPGSQVVRSSGRQGLIFFAT
jgi:hypothetical protein